MFALLISFVAFIVAISILVAIHEFGHFWVARRNGIRVLRFSIGFGKPLYRWYDKQGTEFVISAIPLGGYVSLLGEKDREVSKNEQHLAFSYKSPWVRIAVLLAGPLFNLLFAVLIFWIIYLSGVSVYVPILGHVPKNSIAEKAGLKKGQEIISVNHQLTSSWENVGNALLTHIGEDKMIDMVVKDSLIDGIENGNDATYKTIEYRAEPKEIKLDLSAWEEGTNQEDILQGLGLEPFDPILPIIYKLIPGCPAEKAGFQVEDKILSINHIAVTSRTEAVDLIQKYPSKAVMVEVLRANQKLEIQVTPATKVTEKGEIGFIGVEFPTLTATPKTLMRVERYGPFAALALSVKKTLSYSVLTLQVMKKMIIGQLSVRHISGPITIAKYAGQTAYLGLQQFLNFMALISISLGVLNLLPIPILDGGHILFCFAEILNGKPLSNATQNIGLWLGGLILFCFMFLAFYNDIMRILY